MLTLRRVQHPMATENYRVIYDGVEVGSIGIQQGVGASQFWSWGIDTILPRQLFATDGRAESLEDAKAKFRAAWETFISDHPDRLSYFMKTQTQRGNGGRR